MTEKITNIIKEEPFTGEDGLSYIRVTKEILTPRKTYLKGIIKGKYSGNKIPDDSDKYDLFDFTIYEAEVSCNSIDDFSKNRPFIFPQDFKNITNCNKIKGTIFPKEKLPKTLPVIISANNKTFGINVLEPQLFEFEINRKYHQTEGDDVFGTFTAFLTGYVFDYEREEEEEILGPIVEPPPPPPEPHKCESNGIKTGEFEKKKGYIRYEYFCQHHPDTVWGPWIKNGPIIDTPPGRGGGGSGCFGDIITVIGLVLFVGFLIAVLPVVPYFLGFYIIILLIGLLSPYLKWIFRILGLLLLLAFFGALVKTCSSSSSRVYHPAPVVTDSRENTPVVEPTVNNTDNHPTADRWIKHYRKWQDYEGVIYEGYYKIKQSSVDRAHAFKNSLGLTQNNINSYDEIVFNLKENDKNELSHVYTLFDSINKTNKLDRIRFAKMIVSFVQDIPYAIVLEETCDPNLYNDSFTRNFLLQGKGDCDPYERFGINTPVEFLANLKGDCDTRTLLLYTLFSHYDYDVALMSSEFYGHSLLGINLPIEGTAYIYNGQSYVLWETTSPNAMPGRISNEISNLNNWRISLKSK
ncbi:hypothetical protein [Flavobacterium sp. XGLA_31]|uniref:hypothetical protein n=1 Tax=Flavobacterium sp. XGLA_31 TaxID=3447666 RepID=UPI003F2B6CD0